MKKLLIILGVMVLTITTNVNVVACGSCKSLVQKTDLNSLSTTAIVTLENTNKTVNDYENTLINFLAQNNFSSLTTTDVNITNVNGIALIDSNIQTGILNTKITAKTTSQNFKGTITINVTIAIKNLIIALDLPEEIESLTFHNNDLYAGAGEWTGSGKIYKININNKTKTEIINLGAGSGSSILAFHGNDLYAGTANGEIYKINTAAPTPTKTEIINLGSKLLSLAFKNNDLYAGTITAGRESGKIYKINITAPTPTKNEIINLDSWADSLLFKDNDLYVGTVNGKIYKINITAPTPTKTEIINLDSSADGLVFKDNILYAGTLNGKIYKINVTNKTKSTIADLKSKIHSLSFYGNDLYVGCTNQLYKVDF